MPTPSRFFFFLIMSLQVLSGCAAEQSKEEKEREDIRREEARLNKAAGEFIGFIVIDDDRVVPVTLTNRVQSNPNDGSDKPRLRSEMQVGFFGGTRLSTTQTSYDHGASSFSAIFDQAGAKALQGAGGAGIPIEFRAQIADRQSTTAHLDTVSGRYEVVLEPGSPESFMAAAEEYDFVVQSGDDASEAAGLLTLKRLAEDIAAPSGSDFPVQPSLEGAINFLGTGPVRNEAEAVTYHPLRGLLEINFSGQSRLVYSDVFLPRSFALDQMGRSLPDLNEGQLFLSGNQVATIRTVSGRGQLHDAADQYPPQFYYGSYQPKKKGETFDIIASVEPTGDERANEGDSVFKDFPATRVTLHACLGGVYIAKRVFEAYQLDQLNKVLRVRDARNSQADEKEIEFDIDGNWAKLTGRFLSQNIVNPSSQGTLRLKAAPENFERDGCMLRVEGQENRRRDGARDGDFPDDGILKFNGHLERDGASKIPAQVMIFPRRDQNGDNEDPSLQVTMKLGFFGGASLASQPAYFDWGTGEVIASFNRAEGAALEFRTTLQTEVIDDARLLGPNLGVNRIYGKRDGRDFFQAENDYTYYDITIGEASATADRVDAVMAMQREREDRAAPANIDLPSLPSLKTSLKLAGLAQTPQVSTGVIYDPLRGKIEIQLSSSSKIELYDLFLNDQEGVLEIPRTTKGRVVLGATTLREIEARQTPSETAIRALPPRNFVGSYQGRPGVLKMKAVASVVYLQTEGQNTPEFPFPSFPKLEIAVTLCAGNQVVGRRRNELVNVDHLAFSALFEGEAGSNQDDLMIWYDPNWEVLEGVYIDPEAPHTGVDRGHIQLNLQQIDALAPRICETPEP